MKRRDVGPRAGPYVSLRVVVGIGVVSMVTGVALANAVSSRGGAGPSIAPASAASLTAEQGTGPADTSDGMPSGFARTREGAIAAAAAYVTTGQRLLDLDPITAERAARRMAANAFADRFAADTMTQLRTARETLAGGSGPIIYRQAVLAHRVEAFDSHRATVAVWNVGVLTREGVAPPQAAWATSTVDLVWEHGDWRIWSETIVPGPAPILNDSVAPATSAEFTRVLDGFIDFARSS